MISGLKYVLGFISFEALVLDIWESPLIKFYCTVDGTYCPIPAYLYLDHIATNPALHFYARWLV